MEALAQEVIAPDEAEVIDRLVEMNLKTLGRSGGVTKRGQHGKHHGCVRGKFKVHEHLPPEFAHGVFQPRAVFDCLIRFSNGGQLDDQKKDAHGMAIKLLGVAGQKLLPDDADSQEHDFLLVDHPTFFCRDLKDYVTFNRHFTKVQALKVQTKSPGHIIAGLAGLAALLLMHRKLLKRASRFAGQTLLSPLATDYHSTTPYCLGTRAVKYKAVSLQPDSGQASDADGLGEALWRHLSSKPATFDFGIIVQSDEDGHPVEDPTLDWEANGAAYASLATLTLEKQAKTPDNDDVCERLIFSPWRCLAGHRPLGVINRARRQVYLTLSRIRSEDNAS